MSADNFEKFEKFDETGAHDDAVRPLEDARYDAIVLWCEARDAERPDDRGAVDALDALVALDLVITAGVHRGDTLTVLARPAVLGGRDSLDVVGVPCVLVVRDGRPLIEL